MAEFRRVLNLTVPPGDAGRTPLGSERQAPVPDEGTRRQIEHHFAVFQDVVTLGTGAWQRGLAEGAAVCAEIAAWYAWLNHPGLFASPRLEDLLAAVGRRTMGSVRLSERRSPPAEMPAHVVHVLSEAYPIGGHTRLVWRWIQLDPGRRHSIVLTHQERLPVPRALREAARATGSDLHLLDTRRSLLARAGALRRITEDADLVVLHVHPYDAIPVIAFADGQGPPVILMNHADHQFWVGTQVSAVVVNSRSSGFRLAYERRGIPRERCALLPLPIPLGDSPLTRSQARQQLGVPEDAIVMLSVASEFKYVPLRPPGFAETMASVLERHANAVVLVVGPEHGGDWAAVHARTGGRIRAMGIHYDTEVFYRAADIYVDSFPICSETAFLEAASHGVASVSCCPHPDEASSLCTDVPSLDTALFRAGTPDELGVLLSRLIEDAAFRALAGERLRQAVCDMHSGDGWRRILHAVYRQASSSPAVAVATPLERGKDRWSSTDLDVLLVGIHGASGFSRGLDARLQAEFARLPFALRAGIWASVAARERALVPGLLLPRKWGKWVEEWRGHIPSRFYSKPAALEAALEALTHRLNARDVAG